MALFYKYAIHSFILIEITRCKVFHGITRGVDKVIFARDSIAEYNK